MRPRLPPVCVRPQISMNAPVMVEVGMETDPLEIAYKELREKKIPFIIRWVLAATLGVGCCARVCWSRVAAAKTSIGAFSQHLAAEPGSPGCFGASPANHPPCTTYRPAAGTFQTTLMRTGASRSSSFRSGRESHAPRWRWVFWLLATAPLASTLPAPLPCLRRINCCVCRNPV